MGKSSYCLIFLSRLNLVTFILASLRCVARCVARRAFYSGSVVVNISRNTLPGVNGGTPQISMENVANRRRFEVPGEYNLFLCLMYVLRQTLHITSSTSI